VLPAVPVLPPDPTLPPDPLAPPAPVLPPAPVPPPSRLVPPSQTLMPQLPLPLHTSPTVQVSLSLHETPVPIEIVTHVVALNMSHA
jgi:WNK lysine deficient protein kinase